MANVNGYWFDAGSVRRTHWESVAGDGQERTVVATLVTAWTGRSDRGLATAATRMNATVLDRPILRAGSLSVYRIPPADSLDA